MAEDPAICAFADAKAFINAYFASAAFELATVMPGHLQQLVLDNFSLALNSQICNGCLTGGRLAFSLSLTANHTSQNCIATYQIGRQR